MKNALQIERFEPKARWRRMKIFLCTIFGTFFVFGVCFADEDPEVKAGGRWREIKIGWQFGQNLKLQGVDIDDYL